MKLTEKITSLFSTESKISFYEENNVELTLNSILIEVKSPTEQELQGLFNYISKRDRLNVWVQFDSSGSDIHLEKGHEAKFLSDLVSHLQYLDEDDERPLLKVKIVKAEVGNKISVYDLDGLVSFWLKDGLVPSLKKIYDMKQRARTLCLQGLESSFRTNMFNFVPQLEGSEDIEFNESIQRETVLTKRDKVCHFANSVETDLIPDDFHILDTNVPCHLSELFSKLKLLLSLVFICDFSRIEESKISFRLNGYRLLTKDVTSSDEIKITSSNEFYDIYKWIYGDGELIDKIGLARNLISLHLNNDDLTDIYNGTLQSITSGYQIYLKENVKQYIEIKNKLSEFIQASSDKASDIAKNIGSYYRNSIWTLYTFFFSIFLIRAFIRNEEHLITTEVLYFYAAFVVLTILAMSYALNELDQDKKRLDDGYNRLKNRYKDLLLKEDLNKILDNDKQHNADIEYLKEKKEQYRKLWATSLAVVSVMMAIMWLSAQN